MARSTRTSGHKQLPSVPISLMPPSLWVRFPTVSRILRLKKFPDHDSAPIPFESQFFHDDPDDAFVDDAIGPAANGDGDADDLWQGTQGKELKKSRPENVNFAKKAKRVDVKRLKDDIWSGLRTLVPDKGSDEDEVCLPGHSKVSRNESHSRSRPLQRKKLPSGPSTRSSKISERPTLKTRCPRSPRHSASSVSFTSPMRKVYGSRRRDSTGGMGMKEVWGNLRGQGMVRRERERDERDVWMM